MSQIENNINKIIKKYNMNKKILFLYLFFALFSFSNIYSANISESWNDTIDIVEDLYVRDGKVDSNNNVYVLVSAISPYDFSLLASYDNSGNHRWNLTINYSNIIKIAVDSSNNVYLAGQINETDGDNDAFIVSYDSSGNHRWNVTVADSSLSYDSSFEEMIIDSSDNIYLGVYLGRITWYSNISIISYDSTGNHRWNISTTFSGDNYIRGMDLDSSSNIYWVGSINAIVDSDMFIGSYDSSGNHRWNHTYFSDANFDKLDDIDSDSNGNTCVVGTIDNLDFFLAKFDNTGTQLYNDTIHYGGTEIGRFSAIDSTGNCYFVGRVGSFPFDHNIIKYDNLNLYDWNITFEFLRGIKLDSRDYLTVLGYNTSGSDFPYIASYNNSGELRWNKTYPSLSDYEISEIDNGNTGEFFLFSDGNIGENDYIFLAKLTEGVYSPPSQTATISSVFPFSGFLSLIQAILILLGFFVYEKRKN